MHIDEMDQDIMDMEKDSQLETGYQKYILDRFEVDSLEDGVAMIADNEMGLLYELHCKDELADGNIEVKDGMVLFHPPRADINSFPLHSKEEMMPMSMEHARKKFHNKHDELEHENGLVLIIGVDKDMEE
tara:strand:+ start:436 stop:825 length:390 start_codon:yes stop_codon:yes gene_type:complete